jgi:hypothetical protein
MRIFLVFTSALLLTGCVGLAVGSFGTFENSEEFTPEPERNQFGFGGATSYTTERVIELWGQPNESYKEGACTVYSYHDGLNWSGVGVFVLVVPVPLLVPSGKDEVRIYFRDNQRVAAVSEYGEVTSMFGYMCGSNECEFLAGAVNTDQTRKVSVTWCS